MRKLVLPALVTAALALTAAGVSQATRSAPALTAACAKGSLDLVKAG